MKGLCPECGRKAVERPLMANGLCPEHSERRRRGRGPRDPWRSLNDEAIPGDEAGAGEVQARARLPRSPIEEARRYARQFARPAGDKEEG